MPDQIFHAGSAEPGARRTAAGPQWVDPDGILERLARDSNLTRDQLLVWLGQERYRDLPIYNAAAYWVISAAVDHQQLEQSFRSVVLNSDALCTVIRTENGFPRQRVLPGMEVAIERVDLSHSNSPLEELRCWAQQRAQRHFVFHEPMIDSALVKLGPEQYAWYLNHHRIIADGWSTLLIFRRTVQVYTAAAESRAAPAPSPAFADYVHHQQQLQETPEYLAALEYWENKLSVSPERLWFAAASGDGLATCKRRISCELGLARSHRLRTLAASPEIAGAFPNMSLFSLLSALFWTYLFRFGQHGRIALGTPVMNRASRKFQETIGPFVHMAVLHLDLSPEETVLSLVGKAQTEMVDVLRHQFVTLATTPQRPLYDAVINYCLTKAGTFLGSAVHTESIDHGYQDDSQEKLALQIRDFDSTGSFVLDFEFRRDTFDEPTAECHVREYVQLLDAFLDDPHATVAQLQVQSISSASAETVPSASVTPVSVDDRTLPEPGLPIATGPSTSYVPPRTETEDILVEIWSKVLGLERIGVLDHFFALGGHSLAAVRIFAGIEQVFGVNLPLTTLLEAPTIEQLGVLLDSESGLSAWSSLVQIQAGHGKPPLFCAHGAAGDVLVFRNLAKRLHSRPVYGLRARGLDGVQQPHERVEDMAADYIGEMRKVQPSGPYFLVGYSFGGLVSYEIARQLRQQGEWVGLLGLFDTRKLLTMRAVLLNLLLVQPKEKLAFCRAAMWPRTYRWDLRPWQRLTRRVTNRPARLSRAARMARVRKSCLRAMRHYVPQPYDGRVAYFRTNVFFAPYVTELLRYPWEELCVGPLEIYNLPSDHWQILSEPYVEVLAQHLEHSLENAVD